MAIKSIGIDIREANGLGAGKGRYAEEITHALIRQAPHIEFFLFTKEPNPSFENNEHVHQIVIKGRGLKWHFNLKRYLKHHPVDFFLATTSYIYPAIAPSNQNIATVVHDLIAFLHPEHNHWFPTWVEKLSLARAMDRSALVVTVSNHTWKDLEALKPQVQNKPHIVVTPAVSDHLHPSTEARMALPDRFLLAVGTLQPRKNIQGVIKAFEQIADARPQLNLCIAGGKGWKSTSIYEAIPTHLKSRIHFLGYVNHNELIELYSRAQALVFPSFYEGFGIPPLEAMACECPVITSNVSSLPEVVGDAAIMIDPNSTDQLVDAIKQILGPQIQAMAIKRGLQQVKAFTWDKSAQSLLAALNKLFKR